MDRSHHPSFRVLGFLPPLSLSSTFSSPFLPQPVTGLIHHLRQFLTTPLPLVAAVRQQSDCRFPDHTIIFKYQLLPAATSNRRHRISTGAEAVCNGDSQCCHPATSRFLEVLSCPALAESLTQYRWFWPVVAALQGWALLQGRRTMAAQTRSGLLPH